jgi:hypothetical protein
MRSRTTRGRPLLAALAGILLIGADPEPAAKPGEAPAAQAPAGAEAPPPNDAIETEAVDALWRATSFLAAAERFSVTIESSYDAVQVDGEKIEFGATRTVLVRRPGHVRVDTERRDGNRGGIAFDGEKVTVWDADENVFAVAPKAGDLDELIDYLVEDLDYPVPLGTLVRRDLPERAIHRLQAATLVGDAKIDGVDCEQIAFRNESTDFQVWIAKGEPPVFRRIVISYRMEEGQPQFRARLRDWSFAPDTADARFAFRPPEGAEQIPFAPRRRGADGEGAQ